MCFSELKLNGDSASHMNALGRNDAFTPSSFRQSMTCIRSCSAWRLSPTVSPSNGEIIASSDVLALLWGQCFLGVGAFCTLQSRADSGWNTGNPCQQSPVSAHLGQFVNRMSYYNIRSLYSIARLSRLQILELPQESPPTKEARPSRVEGVGYCLLCLLSFFNLFRLTPPPLGWYRSPLEAVENHDLDANIQPLLKLTFPPLVRRLHYESELRKVMTRRRGCHEKS